MGGRGGVLPYWPNITVDYAFISSSRFQISLIGLKVLYMPKRNANHSWHSSWEWDDTDFASRSNTEWQCSHQWAITCSIGVQSFWVQWCSYVAKMRMAPEKAVFMQKFAMSTTLIQYYQLHNNNLCTVCAYMCVYCMPTTPPPPGKCCWQMSIVLGSQIKCTEKSHFR